MKNYKSYCLSFVFFSFCFMLQNAFAEDYKNLFYTVSPAQSFREIAKGYFEELLIYMPDTCYIYNEKEMEYYRQLKEWTDKENDRLIGNYNQQKAAFQEAQAMGDRMRQRLRGNVPGTPEAMYKATRYGGQELPEGQVIGFGGVLETVVEDAWVLPEPKLKKPPTPPNYSIDLIFEISDTNSVFSILDRAWQKLMLPDYKIVNPLKIGEYYTDYLNLSRQIISQYLKFLIKQKSSNVKKYGDIPDTYKINALGTDNVNAFYNTKSEIYFLVIDSIIENSSMPLSEVEHKLLKQGYVLLNPSKYWEYEKNGTVPLFSILQKYASKIDRQEFIKIVELFETIIVTYMTKQQNMFAQLLVDNYYSRKEISIAMDRGKYVYMLNRMTVLTLLSESAYYYDFNTNNLERFLE